MRADITFEDYRAFEIISGSGNFSFAPHLHKYDCLVTVTGGKMAVALGGLGEKVLNQGDCVYIPAFTPHTLTAVDSAPYAYTTFCVKSRQKRFGGTVCAAVTKCLRATPLKVWWGINSSADAFSVVLSVQITPFSKWLCMFMVFYLLAKTIR